VAADPAGQEVDHAGLSISWAVAAGGRFRGRVEVGRGRVDGDRDVALGSEPQASIA
jgi:hypothetical protein